jgi:hypothetical protein
VQVDQTWCSRTSWHHTVSFLVPASYSIASLASSQSRPAASFFFVNTRLSVCGLVSESPKIAAEKAEYVKKPKELNETIPIYGIVSLGRLIATFNNCMSVAQLVAFLEHFLYIQL